MDKNTDLEERHDIEAELVDSASFNDNKVLEISFEIKESITKSIGNIIILLYRRKVWRNLRTL